MARNGIAVYVDASLGLQDAGLTWLPLPESGIPAGWREALGGEWRTFSLSLCAEKDLITQHISVTSADWAGVEAWVATTSARVAEERAKIAVEKAEVEAARSLVEAAIANPGESTLIRLASVNLAGPWEEWSCESGDVLRRGYAWDDLWTALESEAIRRTGASRTQWARSVAEMSDDELLKFAERSPHDVRRHLDKLTRDRIVALEEQRDKERAQTSAREIREALSTAPAHVLERYDAGFLPKDELVERLADAKFGAIDLPRYVDLIDDDYEHDPGCDEPEIKFSGRKYDQEDDTLDAEEWASWRHVREVLTAAGYEPQLRMSRVYCTCSGCDNGTYKLSARISTTIGGVAVKRDYAVG